MALHRKWDALLSLKPDIAVISECANFEQLTARGDVPDLSGPPLWMGRNKHKGLGVFTFNGYSAHPAETFHQSLCYILPLHIEGPVQCNLIGVWAQNASAGLTRKHQAGPFRRALTKYKTFLTQEPCLIAGDLNNNIFWDKPGWRANHQTAVDILETYGLTSAYHHTRGEAQGAESTPTLYWRDRKKDGPTYHIDYIFLPTDWADGIKELSVGSFEDWCGSGLSDHVPIVMDITV